jgi:Type II secretion system (T2SS), protein M subtype b
MNALLGGLSKPYARALALALLLAFLMLVYAVAIEPWLGAAIAHRERMAELAGELEARQSLADRLPSLEARLQALKTDPGSARRLLAGANPAFAATGLQGQLRTIFSAAKTDIVSVEALPADPASAREKGPMRIAARVVFRGQEAGLRDVLRGIEAAVPFLYVQRLAVNTNGGRVADVKSAASHLIVTVEVFGYWRAQALSADTTPAQKVREGQKS